MIPEYPLCWPEHIGRSRQREGGQFRTSLAGALNNVRDSLRRFASDSGKKIEILAISSNVTLANSRPSDPGVAVWFRWGAMEGETICIPVDRYSKVEANLQAIHHVIEARRTELRHGTLALVRASFRGFRALPTPSAARKQEWWEVLGATDQTSLTEAHINELYRNRAKQCHPDNGGSHEKMAELNEARAAGLKSLREQ